jgi:hypothetical protein
MTKLWRPKSYREEGLYVRVQNFLLEKVFLVQEKNLEHPSARATGQTEQKPTIDVVLNHWE